MGRIVPCVLTRAFVLLILLFVGVAQADRFHVYEVPETALYLPGGYIALAGGETGGPYLHTDEDLALFQPWDFAVLAVYDTGTSGILISKVNGDDLGIAKQSGVTYVDEGIGGEETFDVSVETHLRTMSTLPADLGDLPAWIDDPTKYTDHGGFYLQMSRRTDVSWDIVGMPVLANHVMYCKQDYVMDLSFVSGLFYSQTELLDEMPASLEGFSLSFDLQMEVYVDPGEPISAAANPLIKDIRVRDDRKGPDEQSDPRNWLFDTGAVLTIIGKDYAEDIGIDLVNEEPVDWTVVSGVGGDVMLLGYAVDEIALPATNGDELVLHDVIVFVSGDETWDLPAELQGIFGMNLLQGYLVQIGEDLFIQPNFTEFYFDEPNAMLTLVLDPAIVPLPGTFLLLFAGSLLATYRRHR